jgi:hypothetical protein
MTMKIRPSRRGNFDRTGARLAELGITAAGYDHRQNCYADVVIPPGVEAVLAADPLIETVVDVAPEPRARKPDWSSAGAELDLTALGGRLRSLREEAGLDVKAAAAKGKLTAKAIEKIETTGQCNVRDLIALADLYGASLDRIAGRTVVRGDRRRR